MSLSANLLVAIDISKLPTEARLGVAERAFAYAARAGVHRIRLQPPWMRIPPAALAKSVEAWLKAGKPKGGWVTFDQPSTDAVALALAATPYLKTVALIGDARELVSLSDGADTLDLEITQADWDRLRPEIERALEQPLRYDVEQLA